MAREIGAAGQDIREACFVEMPQFNGIFALCLGGCIGSFEDGLKLRVHQGRPPLEHPPPRFSPLASAAGKAASMLAPFARSWSRATQEPNGLKSLGRTQHNASASKTAKRALIPPGAPSVPRPSDCPQ